jgi:Tfp pilus assembly PilM family ATPase
MKGVVLNASKNGKVEILAAGTLPIGELGQMPESTDKTLAMGVKLKELVKSARLRGETRRVGVSGKTTGIKYLQVPPVPPWRLDMLVKYEVQEKSSDKELSAYDYQILGVPEVGGQYTVMIGTCHEATSKELIDIGKASGLGEVEVDLEALAIYNAYYHGHGYDADKTIVIADIGADDVTVLLCRNGALYYARTIMGGGRRFTQVLADELKIEFAEAEELKKTQAEISFDVTPSTGRTRMLGRIPGASGVARGITSMLPRKADGAPGSAASSSPEASAPASSSPTAAPAASRVWNTAAGSPVLHIPKPADSEGAEAKAATGELRLTSERPASQSPPGTTPPANDPVPGSDDLFMMDMPASVESLTAPAEASAASTGTTTPTAPAATLTAGTETTVAPAGSTVMSVDLQPLTGSTPAPDAQVDEKRKRQMSAALVREAATLCATLENAVLFTKQQTKLRDLKVDRVYLTGGGSKLKGLQEFMGRRMRMEVVPLEPLRQISLERLPADQATALKAEQHTLAVALGLALSQSQKGAFSFLLWPEAVEQRKIFWARGAYLYYTAAMVALAIGLFMFTPYRNAQLLAANSATARDGMEGAKKESAEIDKLRKDNDEKRQRRKQIRDNINSGDFFLGMLGELKQRARIADDIYITSISTTMPKVVLEAASDDPQAKARVQAAAAPASSTNAADPDTFQVQRRIFIRGFAEGGETGKVGQKIKTFYRSLVPNEKEPDDPKNLFKSIKDIWYGPDQTVGPNPVQEFVLEAYVEKPLEQSTTKSRGKKPSALPPAGRSGPE